MKYWATRFMAITLLPVSLAACASSSSGAASSGSKAATAASAPTLVKPCGVSVLVLGYGPQVSPMTGEHAVMYKISNRGHAACSLAGYPDVSLYNAKGGPLAFHYTHGHSQYLTEARPRTVVLASGGSAFVVVAKYRCDLGGQAAAATIKLTLPGHPPIVLTGPATLPRSGGAAELDYCKGGPEGPGQTVGISPIEATPSAAGPFAG